MEFILHGAWGFTIARGATKNKKAWFVGTLLGILPDLLGAGPWMYYRNIQKIYDIYTIPPIALQFYNLTHNLITSTLIFLIIYLVAKKYWYLGFAYLLHVILDVFAHCAPIGIKIFYPLSHWSYCSPLYIVTKGPSSAAWSNGLIISEVIQYLLLIGFNLYLSFKSRKN